MNLCESTKIYLQNLKGDYILSHVAKTRIARKNTPIEFFPKLYRSDRPDNSQWRFCTDACQAKTFFHSIINSGFGRKYHTPDDENFIRTHFHPEILSVSENSTGNSRDFFVEAGRSVQLRKNCNVTVSYMMLQVLKGGYNTC